MVSWRLSCTRNYYRISDLGLIFPHFEFLSLYLDVFDQSLNFFEKKLQFLLTVLDLSYASVFILIDIVNDGELAREAYFLHFVRKIKGMNADNLVDKTIRNGRWKHMYTYIKLQSNLTIRNFLVDLKLFLNAKSSLSFRPVILMK